MSSTTVRTASSATRDLALVAAFAGLIAVFGIVPGLSMGFGVPIVLQNLAIMLTGCILGARRGFLATLVFVVLVAIGLPLLSGGRGGLGVFAGPSVGYIVSYPFVAGLIGWLAERRAPKPSVPWLVVANILGGVVLCYALGIAGTAWRTGAPFGTVAWAAISAFVPLDCVKAVIAAVVASAVHRSVPGLLGRR